MQKSIVAVSTVALVLLLSAGVRAAEDEPVSEQPVKAGTEEPQGEIEAVRGIRYRVWLKSGRSMEGVVRARGVFEVLASQGGYRPADDDERGAGVRFWFPSAQDGFIFMPLTAIDRLEELGELSSDEGRTIARARVEAAHRAQRERFQIKARRAAEDAAAEAAAEVKRADDAGVQPESAADAGGAEGESARDTADSQAGRMAALLLKFPPTKWTLDSPKEIERRKVILGLFPSREEKEFLAVFDDWKVAYVAWAKAADDVTDGEIAADEDAKSRRVVRER